MAYEKIKVLRNQSNLTQQEVADILNIPLATYRSYETSKREPTIEILAKLSDYYKVTVDFILDHHINKDNSFSKKELDMVKKYRILDEYGKDIVDTVLEKEYIRNNEQKNAMRKDYISISCSDYPVSAGIGDELADYEQWERILVPLNKYSRKANFVIRVDGDSMEPKYSDGDFILVKKQDFVEIGEIGVFSVDGKGYMKKFGGNRLISLNSKYEDIMLNENTSFKCFGLVLSTTEICE